MHFMIKGVMCEKVGKWFDQVSRMFETNHFILLFSAWF